LGQSRQLQRHSTPSVLDMQVAWHDLLCGVVEQVT
jgi:hypothetical protein